MFYNAIGSVAQCPNNLGVGSVFPTLENTYFYFLKVTFKIFLDIEMVDWVAINKALPQALTRAQKVKLRVEREI